MKKKSHLHCTDCEDRDIRIPCRCECHDTGDAALDKMVDADIEYQRYEKQQDHDEDTTSNFE